MRLANWYIEEYSHIPFAPSRPANEVTMRQLYVAPKIVDKGQTPNDKTYKQVNTLNDFFKKEGSPCKQIFLLGEPGTGKSTFLQNLALQWSELQVQQNDTEMGRPDQLVANDEHSSSDHSIKIDAKDKNEDEFQYKTTLNQIDVLFYVSLRDANKYCQYEDIIYDQLLRKIYKDNRKRAKNLMERLLETPSSFVLSDGLDEWEHPSNGNNCSCPARDKGRTPLIHHTNSATIVTTSRPWRLAQNAPRSSKIEKLLEIDGTSNAQELGQKMVDVLNKQEGKCIKFEDVRTYIFKKGVNNLMNVPILLLQIVCLCFDGTEVSNSQCKIYASIFNMMIGRHSQTFHEQSSTCDTGMSLFTDKVNIRQFWTQFIALGKLAFEQLFQEHGHSAVVFNSNTCNLDDKIRTFARVCGLLTEKESRSFSSPGSHLSFTHKTFQEFLAAVYLSIKEELFETVIKSRYAVADQDNLERCLNDLAQVFLFTCGLNIQMAEKIATLFNSHYRSDMTINSSIEYDFPWSRLSNKYCEKIRVGIAEADENGFKHFKFPLQCINMEIKNEYDASVCSRLLDMNNERLVSVFICTFAATLNFNVLQIKPECKITSQLRFNKCTHLQHITLNRLDLGDQQLLLPDTLTNIYVEDAQVTGGIYLQNCSLLQTLKLNRVNFGEKEMFLSAHNFKHLQELELDRINLDDQELMLPNSLTSLCLHRVTTASGRNGDRNTIARQQHTKHSASISFMGTTCLGTVRLQNCTKLKEIVLMNIDISDHELLLPESINSITLSSVNKSKDVKLPLQHCTSLQKLDLADVKLGDKLVLPDSITELDLAVVTGCLSSFTSLHNLSRLQTIDLHGMDLGDLERRFPVAVKTIALSHLKMSRGLQLQAYPQLIELKLRYMNLANIELKLPDSITNIEMKKVTMSALGVEELCEHFQRLPHTVTFRLKCCTIEPLHDYEQFIQRLKTMPDVEFKKWWDNTFEIRFNCNTNAASSEI